MCGICGFYGFRNDELLHNMTNLLEHRGPDDFGYYVGDSVSLGHRRLSIIDLSTGKQPICNEDRKIWIVFNGEIYNYKEIRSILDRQGHKFSTNSDTEVIVHAYEEWGVECVEKLNGEFVFAIYDENTHQIFLARDRLGIRPLYYCQIDNKLIFSSELKSLLIWQKVPRRINPQALDCYLTLRYIPSSMTLLEGIHKLPPASNLLYSGNGNIQINQYWRTDRPINDQIRIEDASEEFFRLFQDAVRMRLMSDVPLGAYLSGGIDSSAIVGLMSRMMSEPVKTFTIGGFSSTVDELDKARRISQLFGTDHHELIIGQQDYDLLPKIICHMDSPIGDAIIIPTFLLASETSRHVKVVLSGEGADEILAGYIHHLSLKYGHLYHQTIPGFLQDLSIHIIRKIPTSLLTKFFPYPAALGERGKQRVINYLKVLKGDSPAQWFLTVASLFGAQERYALYDNDLLRRELSGQFLIDKMDNILKLDGNFINNVVNYDLGNWLPDYTLIKQDHLAMAHSLEARVPFLDHRLVEFCATLPGKYKIQGLTQKFLLRKSMSRLLPPEVISAPKKAFYIPTEKCFGAGFEDFIFDILNEKSVIERGLFSPQFVASKLKAARSSELVDNKQIMALVILELWFRNFLDGNADN